MLLNINLSPINKIIISSDDNTLNFSKNKITSYLNIKR